MSWQPTSTSSSLLSFFRSLPLFACSSRSNQPCFQHNCCVSSMPPPPSSPPPVPPPVPVETHPNRAGSSKLLPDPTRLAPEDAYSGSPFTRPCTAPADYDDSLQSLSGNVPTSATVAALRPPAVPNADHNQKDARKARGTGRRKKRKGAWKKLLWVKQSCMYAREYVLECSD